MAAALVDRILYHWHIVTIRGNSYRMRRHTELRRALHQGSGVRTTLTQEGEGKQNGLNRARYPGSVHVQFPPAKSESVRV